VYYFKEIREVARLFTKRHISSITVKGASREAIENTAPQLKKMRAGFFVLAEWKRKND